jgi:hypothetical protein
VFRRAWYRFAIASRDILVNQYDANLINVLQKGVPETAIALRSVRNSLPRGHAMRYKCRGMSTVASSCGASSAQYPRLRSSWRCLFC